MGPIGFWWYWIMRDPSHLRKQHRNIALFLCFPCFLRETFFHVNMFYLFIYLVIQCMLSHYLFIKSHVTHIYIYTYIYNLHVCVFIFLMLRQKCFLFIYHVSTYCIWQEWSIYLGAFFRKTTRHGNNLELPHVVSCFRVVNLSLGFMWGNLVGICWNMSLLVKALHHPPLKMYFRGGRGQAKKIHLPFSKNLVPQDPP